MNREEIVDAMWDEINDLKKEEKQLKEEGRHQAAHKKSEQAWNTASQIETIRRRYNEHI